MSEFNKYSTDGGATFIDVEDSEAVHYGNQSKGYVGKNLFINTGKTATVSSVVFTHNSDDSVGLNNTASATAIYNVGSVKELSGINQNVILSGCPSGGSTSTYSLQIRTLASANVIQNGTYLIDNGNGVTFNPSGPLVDTNGNSVSISDLYINIRIGSGEDTTGKTFYPMIRLASVSDSTYEPYLTPNTDLMSYEDNAVLGAKNWNLFPYHNTTKTYADITYTVDDDGVIDVDGTSTGEGQFDIHNINEMPNLLHDVTYILSGAPNVAYSTSDVRLRLITFKDDNTGRVNYDCPQGGEIQFTIPTGHHFHQLAYYIASGKTLNHVKVKPMIRLASDTDNTYAPYAMTNRELTTKAQGIIDAATNAADFAAFKTAIGNL